jgi:hypothetical protein
MRPEEEKRKKKERMHAANKRKRIQTKPFAAMQKIIR